MFFLFFGLHAQRIQYSQAVKVEKKANIMEIAGKNDGGIYVIKKSYRNEQRNIVIERYTDNLKRLSSKEFLTGKNDFYALLKTSSAGLNLFYAFFNKEKNEYQLKVKKLDFNLTASNEDSILFKIPANSVSERFLQVFTQKNDPDILFTYTMQNNDIPFEFNYLMVDSNLQIINSGSFGLSMENKYDIQDAAFNRDHIALIIKEDVKRKTNRLGIHYHILDFNTSENAALMTDLYNDTMTVTEGLLRMDIKNNHLIFAGLYASHDSSYSKGYFIWKRELSSHTTFSKLNPFAKSLVDEMSGKISKVDGIYNLRTGDIILREDGGVVLTCEEFLETREVVFDMNVGSPISQSNYRYYYYYNNLLILSINPNSELDWHIVTKKDQISINDQGLYSSYLLAVLGDRIYYVYNDLARKNWSLNAFKVTPNGVSVNDVLIKSQDYEGRLIPQQGHQIDYNSILIPAYNHSGMLLLKISF